MSVRQARRGMCGGWGKRIFERAKNKLGELPLPPPLRVTCHALSSDYQTRAYFDTVLAFEIVDL